MPGLIVIPLQQNHIDVISSREQLRGVRVQLEQKKYSDVYLRMLGKEEIGIANMVAESRIRGELQELFRIGDGPDIANVDLAEIDWDQDEVYFVSVEEVMEGLHNWYRVNVAEEQLTEKPTPIVRVFDAQTPDVAPTEQPTETAPLQASLLQRIAQILW
jgi:hypothetical protein